MKDDIIAGLFIGTILGILIGTLIGVIINLPQLTTNQPITPTIEITTKNINGVVISDTVFTYNK
jgi:hypothetical protein